MADKGGTVRFSVSLAGDLLQELDRKMLGRGYASRSELVRDLIRERMVEEKWQDARREVVGVLTISYDHHQKDLTEKIVEIQHRRYVNILCATHVHLDHDNCLEVIIIRGRPPEIEKLGIEIGGIRGVRCAKLTRASSVEK
ncbi:MAG: nickel-responsive transcriptional regulator NikR [Candidatus Latescibacterota bacterium]|nr:MAG: nickel-responsive transcriptional regulator NikR [Candidatus Latescibacterota bacterium]